MTGAPPHLTASVLAVDASARQVLLLRHPAYGRWGPVGGHVERDETLAEAARRELAEEVGLVPILLYEPHVAVVQDLQPCGREQGEVRHVDHLFAAVADPAAPLGGELGALAGWFATDALPEPLTPGVAGLIRAATREVARR